MVDNIKALKVLLWIVAVYHIALGLLGIFLKSQAVYLAKTFFNFNFELTQQAYWMINPFAAYILIFGVFMAVAAKDPIKFKNIIYAGVALIAIRIIQRVFFLLTATEGLVISPSRNIIAIVVIAIIGGILFFMTKNLKN